MKWLSILCVVVMTFLGCQQDQDSGLQGRVVEFKLDNGMKWFLLEREYAPVFSGVVQARVGGSDEVSGKTGIAHLLEHMSFKGTSAIGTTNYAAEKEIMEKMDSIIEEQKTIKSIEPLISEQKKYIIPDEIWDLLNRNGANQLNAYTSKDVTTYYADMPSSKLELWIYITSEMIKDPVFREFYQERSVVMEELRTSIDNDPQGKLYELLLKSAYTNSPYNWPTIGREDDVPNLSRKDITEFYKDHYLPECMLGAIVGDININDTKKLLNKYFGQLKGKGTVCNTVVEIDPPSSKEVVAEVKFDAEPMFVMAFHKPTVPSYDDYIFDVFSYLLCEGESSRMQRNLVKNKKIAKQISCFNSYPGTRLSNLFVIYAEPFSADSLGELESSILAELKSLSDEPVRPDELEKIKNQMKMSFLRSIDSNFELAHMFVSFENMVGSWRYILNHSKVVDDITPEDLMTSAKKYFTPANTVKITLKR